MIKERLRRRADTPVRLEMDQEDKDTRQYVLPSEWGVWRVSFSDLGITSLRIPTDQTAGGEELKSQEGAAGREVRRAFLSRMKGGSENIPWELYDLSGHPTFHIKIWKAMTKIPYGEVRSYGQVAADAGSPRAFRAAGQACGANPVVLFIPCHRVVASNGLGGFGSGLTWKKRLLSLEGYLKYVTPALS